MLRARLCRLVSEFEGHYYVARRDRQYHCLQWPDHRSFGGARYQQATASLWHPQASTVLDGALAHMLRHVPSGQYTGECDDGLRQRAGKVWESAGG